jgi:hypothetical protein
MRGFFQGLFTLPEGIALMTTRATGKAQTAAGLDTRRGFATPHVAFVAINPTGKACRNGSLVVASLARTPVRAARCASIGPFRQAFATLPVV